MTFKHPSNLYEPMIQFLQYAHSTSPTLEWSIHPHLSKTSLPLIAISISLSAQVSPALFSYSISSGPISAIQLPSDHTFLLPKNSVSHLLFKPPQVAQFMLLSVPYLIFHPKRVICVKDTWNRFQTNLTSWEDLGSSLLTSVQITKNPKSKRARN